MEIKLNLTIDQIIAMLLQLPAEEKLKVANQLRAKAVAEQWRALSEKLPDESGMSMEEITKEVKEVRQKRN